MAGRQVKHQKTKHCYGQRVKEESTERRQEKPFDELPNSGLDYKICFK